MDNAEKLATLGIQDTGQRLDKNQRSNQEWTMQKNW